MASSYKYTKNARDRVKQIMGNKCAICGYDKCTQALEFHHFTDDKNFVIANVGYKNFSWIKLLKELKLCMLVCKNCHTEIHYNNLQYIAETSYSESIHNEIKEPCKMCGKLVEDVTKAFCSGKCTGRYNISQRDFTNIDTTNLVKQMNHGKFIWNFIDVIELLERNDGVMVRAAKEVNLSDNGVKKRFKKVTGFNNWQEYQQAKLDGMI